MQTMKALADDISAASHPSAPPAPVPPAERFDVLDALRGFALFGIFIINLRAFTGWFAMSSEQREAVASPLDDAVLFLHDWLFQGKFYTLFSLLFGIGFAIQLRLRCPCGARCRARITDRVRGHRRFPGDWAELSEALDKNAASGVSHTARVGESS